MLVIPAIDIKDSHVVRLLKGDFDKEKIYSSNPVELAKELDSSGVKRIHIVDLDAAKTGTPKNKSLITDIVSSVKADIELGGGIREEQTIIEYLKAGVKYVVIGTEAYISPDWFKEMLFKYNQNIILAVDVYDGNIKIRGWQEDLGKDIFGFLNGFCNQGLKTVIYTDISRDGTLEGVDINSWKGFLEKIDKFDLKVIFSGGIGSEEDFIKVKDLNSSNIIGMIVGKALYEGRINIAELKGKYELPGDE